MLYRIMAISHGRTAVLAERIPTKPLAIYLARTLAENPVKSFCEHAQIGVYQITAAQNGVYQSDPILTFDIDPKRRAELRTSDIREAGLFSTDLPDAKFVVATLTREKVLKEYVYFDTSRKVPPIFFMQAIPEDGSDTLVNAYLATEDQAQAAQAVLGKQMIEGKEPPVVGFTHIPYRVRDVYINLTKPPTSSVEVEFTLGPDITQQHVAGFISGLLREINPKVNGVKFTKINVKK